MTQVLPIALLTNAGADATGSQKNLPAGQFPQGRFYSCYVDGTFGGASLKLQVRPPGTSQWYDTGVVLTAQGVQNMEVRAAKVRAVVTGGDGTTSLTAKLY